MKICIAGDSWACGEWGRNISIKQRLFNGQSSLFVLHTGLQFFLEKKHKVINVGLGGSSNFQAVDRLSNAMHKDNFDYIFYFQTDPLRDSNFETFEKYKSIRIQDIALEQNNLLKMTYDKLNRLNKTVYAIGGASKLNDELLTNYTNIVSYIPSLAEFLVKGYTHPLFWQSQWLDYIENKCNIECLDILLKYKSMQDGLMQDRYAKYFQPDGRHPNKYSHKLLYDKIKFDFNL
jgi:hypothetical protein